MRLWQAFLDGFAVSRRGLLLPLSFFAVSVILHLSFLRDIFVPPYFDSVEHYRIIKSLMTALETSTLSQTLPTLTSTYYHLGFHFLASLLALALRANPIDVILVLGQVILAAIPVPVYFLVRRETTSAVAAFFAMLMAGFGWYMPGFAVNWGKYPALAGLLAVGLVLNFADRIAREKRDRRSPALIVLLLLGILTATIFHTRALITIVIAVASWIMAGRIQVASRRYQCLSLGLSLGVILFLRLFVQTESLIKLALEPYLGPGLWVTLIVLALSPFALLHFPRGSYFNVLLILGMFVALFIPAGLQNQTLLDRPLVEMALSLPLSMLGGLGLASLLKALNGIYATPERTRLYVRISTVIVLMIFTVFLTGNYDFSPAECCNFVSYDDTIALDWLDRNLPADAPILVAGTQLNVLAAGPSPGLVGTDAGIWIPNMTGRPIRLASYDTEFHSQNTLREICQMQIEFIYVGSTAQSFNRAPFSERTKWYKRILFLPNVQLYQVTGCP